METENEGGLDTLVQELIENDTGFQESLKDMTEDEKSEAVTKKTTEVRNREYATLQEKQKKDEELAGNYKIRAEKAEEAEKIAKEGKGKGKGKDGAETTTTESTETEKKDDGLSSKDLYALMGAKVPEEDVEEVQKAAKALGKTIAEALKEDIVIDILKKRGEHRATAAATNTKTTRPSSTEITEDQVSKEATEEGKIPEKGTPEAEKLFNARRRKS